MKKQIISTIDLWNQGGKAEDMVLPALSDEFLKYGHILYNEIQIIKNCRVDYVSDIKLPSRSNALLFLRDGVPLRLVLLKQCDLNKTVNFCFNEKCLPNNNSVMDYVNKGEIKIINKDLKQAAGNEFELEVDNGSCDRKDLLTAMLGGSVSAEGGGQSTVRLKKLQFNPKAEVTVSGETDELKIQIPHKGIINMEFENGVKRCIMLQDNGELPLQYVKSIVEQKKTKLAKFAESQKK